MKRATFTIPKQDNEGRTFPKTTILEIQRNILETYGGYTVRSVHGGWMDGDGKVYQEQNFEYTVVLEEHQLKDLKNWLEKMKAVLRQEAMFLEVGDTEVTFI
jgi:hypothetical protein